MRAAQMTAFVRVKLQARSRRGQPRLGEDLLTAALAREMGGDVASAATAAVAVKTAATMMMFSCHSSRASMALLKARMPRHFAQEKTWLGLGQARKR